MDTNTPPTISHIDVLRRAIETDIAANERRAQAYLDAERQLALANRELSGLLRQLNYPVGSALFDTLLEYAQKEPFKLVAARSELLAEADMAAAERAEAQAVAPALTPAEIDEAIAQTITEEQARMSDEFARDAQWEAAHPPDPPPDDEIPF